MKYTEVLSLKKQAAWYDPLSKFYDIPRNEFDYGKSFPTASSLRLYSGIGGSKAPITSLNSYQSSYQPRQTGTSTSRDVFAPYYDDKRKAGVQQPRASQIPVVQPSTTKWKPMTYEQAMEREERTGNAPDYGGLQELEHTSPLPPTPIQIQEAQQEREARRQKLKKLRFHVDPKTGAVIGVRKGRTVNGRPIVPGSRPVESKYRGRNPSGMSVGGPARVTGTGYAQDPRRTNPALIRRDIATARGQAKAQLERGMEARRNWQNEYSKEKKSNPNGFPVKR